MSYNKRRACYVCGQVGHLAENCSSTERLCFNCGKGGHESSACPDPRSTDQKSCYLCLGKGHIKAECPNLNARRARSTPAVTSTTAAASSANAGCFTCGGPHLARNCPQAAAKPAAGAGVVCHNCGGQNHFARDCKARPAAPTGAGRGAPRGKNCYRCSMPGHIARECPEYADPPAPQNVALVN